MNRCASVLVVMVSIMWQTCFGKIGSHGHFQANLICTKTHFIVHVTYEYGDFTGIAYTEGSYSNPDCMIRVDKSNKFMFEIPYDGCKSKQESEHEFSTVLVVQHHERIMTEEDSAFTLKCSSLVPDHAEVMVVSQTMVMGGGPSADKYRKQASSKYDEGKPTDVKVIEKTRTSTIIENDKDTITYVKTKNVTSKNYHKLDKQKQ